MNIKKILSITTTAILLLTAISLPVLAASNETQSSIGSRTLLRRGDANLDGIINTGDSAFILKYLNGEVSLAGPGNLHYKIADANGDGTVDKNDAACILAGNVVNTTYSQMKGDANLDGTLNTGDVSTILRYIEGIIEVGEFAYCLADCNDDGIVNNTDAELLLDYLIMNT
ncbi:MAG: dockerin type I repeat-containing protein [Candidatus Gastranaerophilaceae bacterium]|jgi:hypothetical protein|nr:dockerin type I repeat-containing protein [Christensenellales bacterium]